MYCKRVAARLQVHSDGHRSSQEARSGVRPLVHLAAGGLTALTGKEADVLGLATASWIALVLGVVVAVVIGLIYTRE